LSEEVKFNDLFLMREWNWKDDKREGLQKSFIENCGIRIESHYKSGIEISAKYLDVDGVEIDEETYRKHAICNKWCLIRE